MLETFRFRARFNVEEALDKLNEFGLLHEHHYDRLLRTNVTSVLPLNATLSTLKATQLGTVVELQKKYQQRATLTR